MARKKTQRTVLTAAIVGALLPGCKRSGQNSVRGPLVPTTAAAIPPPAHIEPVVENYFGHTISDPYRWMEKAEKQEDLRAWMRTQGEYAARVLQEIPEREKLASRLRQLMGSTVTTRSLTSAGDQLFYLRTEKNAQVPTLRMRDTQNADRLLLDPTKFEKDAHTHVSINNFSPSHDGRYVACNLSNGGSEISQVHIVETATGRMLPDVLERIWGELRVHWAPDNSGFFYTQMAQEAFADPKLDKLQNLKTYYHRLGTTSAKDVPLLGAGINDTVQFAPEEFPEIWPAQGSDWVLGVGIGARSEQHVLVARLSQLSGAKTPWKLVAEYQDELINFSLTGNTLYFLTTKNAPHGEIRRLELGSVPPTQSVVVVPQGPELVRQLIAAKDALYYAGMSSGVYRLWRLPYDAKTPVEIQLPLAGTIDLVNAPPNNSGVLFSLEGWTQAMRYLAYRPTTGRLEELGLGDESPASFGDVVVKRTEVKSSDGALVPMTVLQPKDLRMDGQNPTIISAYGGYGFSRLPEFLAPLLAWIERGGVYAFAHVRGGGEKGRDWYHGGKGKNKKYGVQDLIACAEQLIKDKYSTRENLAVSGLSMGAILVGRALTERPDLFGAAAISGGFINPMRYLEGVNGANQKAELTATPDTQAGVEILLAMDPYLNIKESVSYPPSLLLIGLNDQRVSPWMSAKFAARLQAVSGGRTMSLLRIDSDDGHGIVGSAREQEVMRQADEWAFFLQKFREHAAAKPRPE